MTRFLLKNLDLVFKGLPVFIVGIIYFPPALLGLALFQDRESVEVLFLIVFFSFIYVCSYGFFRKYFCFWREAILI